jgi:hypothetical protein
MILTSNVSPMAADGIAISIAARMPRCRTALSPSSEFAAQVAAEMPELLLLSPTGFGTQAETHPIQRMARQGEKPRLLQTLELHSAS